MSGVMDNIERAHKETIPELRAEAGLPPEEEDEGGYVEERVRYMELLESKVVGMQAALLMMREDRWPS